MEWISDNAVLIPNEKNGALLQLVDGRDQIYGSRSMLSQSGGRDWIPWGDADNQPNQMALRAMNYTNIIPVFKEVQLTTLDKNPTGKQAVVNHSA